MSVRTPIDGLASAEDGGDILDYLLGSNGLGYDTFVNVPGGIHRGRGQNDWYEVHLVDEDGDGIIRYIELGASGDSASLSDLKQHLKDHGSPINELFTVIARRDADEGPLTSPLADDLTFLSLEKQFSSEHVEVTFGLNYFTVKRSGVEPAHLDFLDDLTVTSEQGRTSHRGDVEAVFSIREVTRSFYKDFREIFQKDLQDAIHGLEDPEENLNTYTRTVVNRVLFLLFIEEKEWLDGDVDYVENRYEDVANEDNMHVYDDFFEPLFFDALSQEGATESALLGRIPFLNGGLFERKDIEEDVEIDEVFFDKLLSPEEDDAGDRKGLLRRYKISLRESNPSEQELVVDPEFIGRIFEMFMQKDERADLGAFYTPKPITSYMAKNALKQHLIGQTNITQAEAVSLVSGHTVPESLSDGQVENIDDALDSATVLDPAVGSGAFIIAMLEELVSVSGALNKSSGDDRSRFQIKKEFLADTLYGVDIDAAGIEMCKFRVWLHLMQDLKNVNHEEFLDANEKFALPNLGFKFFVGNSLVGEHDPTGVDVDSYQETLTGGLDDTLDEIHEVRTEFQDAHGDKKDQLGEQLEELTTELETQLAVKEKGSWMVEAAKEAESTFTWTTNIPEVILDGGFDIVIGNPPYEGQEGAEYKTELGDFYSEKEGFRYYSKTDLFQFFVHRGYELANTEGVFTYIMSDTFFTQINKTDVRSTLLNELDELTRVNPDAFDASVETAIFSLSKSDNKPDEIRLNDSYDVDIKSYLQLLAPVDYDESYSVSIDDRSYETKRADLGEHSIYQLNRELYDKSINKSFFIPTELNTEIFGEFIAPFNSVYDRWQTEIADVSNLEKRLSEVKSLIQDTNSGEILPFGLLTVGGQGISMRTNKDFIHVLKGTKKAERIDKEGSYSRSKLYKTVGEEKVIHDASQLSEEEKLHGVDNDADRTFVKVTRESKSRDLYFCPTDEFVDWSRENVDKLKDQGVPRNDQYYLNQGIATKQGGGVRNLECRMIEPSVFTNTNLVFFSIDEDKADLKYMMGVLNSSFSEYLATNFLNRIGLSTRDVRRLPIKIPDDSEKENIVRLVEEAIQIQKQRPDVLDDPDMRTIEEIDRKLDEAVAEIYGVDLERIENGV
ncbi:Eco57I restriction-modification methylase domain-containing protein [Haloarcula argentinensis]|uniref:site-specific DNA-methyltransferase (adenine-specific) n=1 Tax=Haloarcula argentinensis TaxID=43776 RepID=A0A847UR25_HALAR|nr:N-6 DNA methylase [Haloarcula argentinensis]NLV14058.1 N-6 DNA methylase [Haloarcula argentinensis]